MTDDPGRGGERRDESRKEEKREPVKRAETGIKPRDRRRRRRRQERKTEERDEQQEEEEEARRAGAGAEKNLDQRRASRITHAAAAFPFSCAHGVIEFNDQRSFH